MVVVMLSSAYAIFSSVQKQESYNTLTVGTLDVNFDKTSSDMGNVINLNGAYPISDEDGQKTSPYSFKVTNTGTLDDSYQIKIVDDIDMINEDGCQNNLLPKDKIKVSINEGVPFLLNSVETNDYTVNTGVLDPDLSKEFEIRIWIDENAGNEVLGSHFHGKIIVESENKISNKNIVSAYVYNETAGDTQCITGEEDTCQVSTCYENYNVNSCIQGTIIKYNVNDIESKYFYVLSDDGITMTLQQRENTVYNTSWYTALEDANVTNNTAGPLTVLTKLEEVTSVWENVNDQKYSMGKTLFIDSAYTSCTTAVGQIYSCSSSTYNLNERVSKARMITAQEVNTTGCLGGAAKTCPIWMYNYLNNSTAYDGTVNDNTVDVNGNYNVSYWTMSNSSANGQLAWTVNETGHTWAKAIASLNVGSRAVVVINK